MSKTSTTRYDVAEHLRTPEEMAAYLEACLEESKGDASFAAKALGDIARAKGMTHGAGNFTCIIHRGGARRISPRPLAPKQWRGNAPNTLESAESLRARTLNVGVGVAWGCE